MRQSICTDTKQFWNAGLGVFPVFTVTHINRAPIHPTNFQGWCLTRVCVLVLCSSNSTIKCIMDTEGNVIKIDRQKILWGQLPGSQTGHILRQESWIQRQGYTESIRSQA